MSKGTLEHALHIVNNNMYLYESEELNSLIATAEAILRERSFNRDTLADINLDWEWDGDGIDWGFRNDDD